MRRENPDEYLRDLERRAAHDPAARRQLHLERRRRGIPSPLWRGARRLWRHATDYAELVAIRRLYDRLEYQWAGRDWNVDDYYGACRAHALEDGRDSRCQDCVDRTSELDAQVREDAERARDAAQAAVGYLLDGHLDAAWREASEAARLERQYGDTPVWGQFQEAVRRYVERRGVDT